MDNFLLFKQIVCLILFVQTLSAWSRFGLYFGPPVFPHSLFKTPTRITIFQIFLLTNLTLLFLDIYPLISSFILLLCTRYLYVSDADHRLSTYGAVGYFTYFTVAYLFFLQASLTLDPSQKLFHFLFNLLALEIGIILLTAGIHKWRSGYFKKSGFEYALVNPSWGKLFFLFKRLKPSSWFFKINNIGATLLECAAGLFILIPQTRSIGALLILLIFIYVFLTVRVNALPLLMMSLALLYLQKIPFDFPTFSTPSPELPLPHGFIVAIEAFFICYFVFYIAVLLLHKKVKLPKFIDKMLCLFCAYRPYFEWDVFTFPVIDYFVTIKKVSKKTEETTEIIYDGFSKKIRNPKLFLRFIHHHESSLILGVFFDVRMRLLTNKETEKKFIERLLRYSKTFLSNSEYADSLLVFTVNHIQKIEDTFVYQPVGSFFVDLETNTVSFNA